MSAVAAPASLDFRSLWGAAIPFSRFLDECASEHVPLWKGVYRTASIPTGIATLDLAPSCRLLVIAEDWCGDGANTVPVIQRWAEEEGIELRILRRDEHPAVMDHYLVDGARSIPVVIALDADFRELGHWGPRPAELQAWVLAHKDSMDKDARYKEIRRWYARDRGETTLREVAGLMVRQ